MRYLTLIIAQGHGLQFPQWCHSMANIKSINSIFYIYVFVLPRYNLCERIRHILNAKSLQICLKIELKIHLIMIRTNATSTSKDDSMVWIMGSGVHVDRLRFDVSHTYTKNELSTNRQRRVGAGRVVSDWSSPVDFFCK